MSMEPDLSRLPLAVTSFAEMVRQSKIYVDKTDLVGRIARSEGPVFLSRPRRFGKSTLVNTFHELFAHGLSSFKGLKIETQHIWDDPLTYQVLHLDFSLIKEKRDDLTFPQMLRTVIKNAFAGCHYEFREEDDVVGDFAAALLSFPNRSLVLLVDEYDSPLAQVMQYADEFENRRALLSAFFLTVKSYAAKFRFIFITGVTNERIDWVRAAHQEARRWGVTILGGTHCSTEMFAPRALAPFFRDLGLADPDVYLNAVGDDLGATVGNIINCSYKLMNAIKPDAVLILGDTNSCLSAISAKRLHIPIFHMEAGNRCKDECLPEETNRRIVDIISDVNLAYSEHARKYLHECGLPKERVYVTGSPMAEVLHANLPAIEASDIHQRLGLTKGKYILLSAHREENIDTEKNFRSLFTAVNAMAEKYDMPILYSCHPRSRKRLEESGFRLDPRVIQHEPLGFHDYNCLQMNAFAVVSDSGTLPEESSFFTSVGHPFPAVCIRTSTERPEALDKACFVLAGIDENHLLQAVDIAVQMNLEGDYGIPVPDYVEENVSTKVVKIIQSYTGVVDKMVWRKY